MAPRTSAKKSRAPLPKKSIDLKSLPASVAVGASPAVELGSGTFADPFTRPLAAQANTTGCFHCPGVSCDCQFFKEALAKVFLEINKKRITEVCGSKHLCAKSLLPQFVSRIARLMHITSDDTFVDLGCGNGSILFQMAYTTGAKCIGVELLPHNADVARQTWAALRPILELRAGRKMPDVEIITGDLCQLIALPWFVASPKLAVLTSNLLFPKSITHYMSERFRALPAGARIMCFDDLYPHSRSVARVRDPEAFELFQMADYVWQSNSVEWTTLDGSFYIHTRK